MTWKLSPPAVYFTRTVLTLRRPALKTRHKLHRSRAAVLLAMPRSYHISLDTAIFPRSTLLAPPLSSTEGIRGDNPKSSFSPPRTIRSLCYKRPITYQGRREELLVSNLLISSCTVAYSVLRATLGVHMLQNHTPCLRSRIAFRKFLIVIPHQLTIRFHHNRSLRVRVNRRSAVEVEPRVGYRCGKVRFVRDEKLSQRN